MDISYCEKTVYAISCAKEGSTMWKAQILQRGVYSFVGFRFNGM